MHLVPEISSYEEDENKIVMVLKSHSYIHDSHHDFAINF